MSALPTPSRRTLSPLLLLEAGTLLTGIGNGVALVVLPWLVLDLTGSAAAAGAVASAQIVPLLVASLFSGTIVDMVGRRRTALVADVLSGVSVAVIPLLAAFDRLDLVWLVVLTMLGAALDPAGATARESMLPGAATAAGWSWDRANAVHEAIFGVAFLLGPGLGGLLIGLVGAENALVATAVGFGLAVLLTLFLRVEGARPAAGGAPAGARLAGHRGRLPLRLAHRAAAQLDAAHVPVVAAYLPFESVVLPVYFNERGDPETLGLVVTAMSAGGVVGSLAYPPVVRLVGRRNLFVGCVVLGLHGACSGWPRCRRRVAADALRRAHRPAVGAGQPDPQPGHAGALAGAHARPGHRRGDLGGLRRRTAGPGRRRSAHRRVRCREDLASASPPWSWPPRW